MKVVVCFKTIAEYESIAPQDWVVDDEQQVDTTFARRIFNCYEESALELALRVADETAKNEDSTNLTALTIDDHRADLFIRQLFAVGYDQGVRIEVGGDFDLRFNPTGISNLISSYLSTVANQDLLLFGSSGGVGESGQTGALTAERLGWPCISNVVDVTSLEDNLLRVTLQAEGITTKLTVELPAVLVITNTTVAPFLRVPTLQQKFSSKRKCIHHLGIADLQKQGETLPSTMRLCSLEKTMVEPKKCRMVVGGDTREKAFEFYRLLRREYWQK